MFSFTRMTAVAVALTLGSTAAIAGSIDTTPFWDGSTGINAFGSNSTGVYGETFTAPETSLSSFTFYVNDGGNALNYVAQVYAWSGSLYGGNGQQGAVGPALFSSGPRTSAATTGFQTIKIDTGSTPLTVGQNYVLLFADTGGDSSSAFFGLTGFYSHPGVAGDGGFNFYNNGNDLGLINSSDWNGFNDFGSLAYTATFGAVPEPASWALMLIGFGAMGVSVRSQRKTGTATA